MIVPAIVAAIYQERPSLPGLITATLVTTAAGFVAWRFSNPGGEISTSEAFATVAGAWVAISAFGALPYLFTGSIPSITGAFFESASGFTATGASVVPDPASLSHGVLFWRAMTQWLGGMGVIVLAVALLPLLGVGAFRLAEAEAPGPTLDRITPRFQETAKRLWLVYAALTLAQVILLVVGEMTLFEAFAHAFTTLSGGGFGTEAASLGAFSAYSQWVVVVFMIAGATSFTLHWRSRRDPSQYFRNAEFRLFLWILSGASLIAVLGTWGGSVATTVRDAVFSVTSVITTTGFATADFNRWASHLGAMLVLLMFVGAMSGSTSGSVKVSRIDVAARSIWAFRRRLLHPRGVFPVRSGGKVLTDPMLRSIRTFVGLYIFVFAVGTLSLGMVAMWAGSDLSIVTTASAVAASLGNIGPGLEGVGPTQNFAIIPDVGKWLLAVIMIIGRLEILPVLMLFSREAWRR